MSRSMVFSEREVMTEQSRTVKSSFVGDIPLPLVLPAPVDSNICFINCYNNDAFLLDENMRS
jgi:hypothetical protein